MKITVNLISISLVLSMCWTTAKGQEFYEDGSMKIYEIASDKKYGYKPTKKNSIKVGKIENEYAYLNALSGPNGEQLKYRRISSCCKFKSKTAAFGSGFLDKYEIFYQGLKDPIVLYLNGYEYETPKAPYGFKFVSQDKVEKPAVYSSEKILKVDLCNEQKTFAVKNETLLTKKFGEMEAPDVNPTFLSGSEDFQNYFKNNPLNDRRAEEMVFRVAIGFIVNCNGNAGNYTIISNGKGLLETLANQVLEIVNKMPNKWNPAKKDNKDVDCYQVLSFTVLGGKLDKVSFR